MPCFFKTMGWQTLLHGKMNLNICIYRQNGGASRWRIGYQQGLPHQVFLGLNKNLWTKLQLSNFQNYLKHSVFWDILNKFFCSGGIQYFCQKFLFYLILKKNNVKVSICAQSNMSTFGSYCYFVYCPIFCCCLNS